MSLSTLDRDLVRDCLQGDDAAWRTFCERFAGLITQVVEQSALAFEMAIDESTRNELVTEVFSSIVDRNFTLLRRFRGESSLATYLTIVARRIAVKRLQGMKVPGTKSSSEIATHSTAAAGTELRIDNKLRIDNQLRIDTQSPSAQAVPTPSATKPLSPNPEEAH